jgi:hypothetical protein
VESVTGPTPFGPVYNMEVDEHHTYFVGSPYWGFAIWAHNADALECMAGGAPTAGPPGALGRQRTPAENGAARNKWKNNKPKGRKAWEDESGQKWPTDKNGNPWPGEHTPPLKEGGDPLKVTPRDPGAPDPHNIPGEDGLTDYQKRGALGPRARKAKKLLEE